MESQTSLLNKLEASRKELLDLGLRNPLLNYRLPAGKGIHVVQEKPAAIFDLLVRQGKAMSFAGRPTKEGSENEIEFIELSESEQADAYTDTKLQTNETETGLQKRLLNTYYAANTILEEQGVNILYLTLGMLQWYEADNSQELRLAPLVLLPVTLERSSARERFRLRHSLEEIGMNISLKAKLKTEFGIVLPELPEADDLDIDAYLDAVAKAVQVQPRWAVDHDALELGFFSFGKFMIYNDLDSANWPEDKKPVKHPLLQNIFETGFHDPRPDIPDGAFIDRDTNAHQLFQVVDADSSQVHAMLAVHEGRNLVIQGPPGTGKSQTITNIIANAIGQGKKVLFVAEKMAALEVVKRRLDTIHLGEACLELHSHKANKKDLHQELRRVLDLGKPTLAHLEKEVSLLSQHLDELNNYCTAVNTPIGQSGLSMQQVIGRLLLLAEESGAEKLPRIPLPDIDQWDAETMHQAEAFAERIQARLKDTGTPANMDFWGTGLTVLLPSEQESLKELLQEALESVAALDQASASCATAMQLMVPHHREATAQLATWAHVAGVKPDLQNIAITDDGWLLHQADLDELLDAGKRLSALHNSYADIFIPEIWSQDVMQIRKDMAAHGEKWYKFLIGAYGRSKRQLAAFCKKPLPRQNSARLKFLDDILESKRLEQTLREHEDLAKTLFGQRWQHLKSNWAELAEITSYLTSMHQQVAGGKCPAQLLRYLTRLEPAEQAMQQHAQLSTLLENQQIRLTDLTVMLQLDEQARFAEKRLLDLPFSEQQNTIRNWLERLPEIHRAIAWNQLAEAAREARLECLTEAASRWEQAETLLKAALQKSWFGYLYEKAIHQYPPLRRFERNSHEETASQFKKADVLKQQYNRAQIALVHWEKLPRLEAGGQMTVLRTEFNKRSRHMSIRNLMQEAGLAIQAIKPVFMMSPMSVANFLPPGSFEFDLVVFDEASQVRPVEALGAILRGKQLVVVGDTKQLPPTSFFDSMTKETEDEENVTADIQSILGMCDAQGAPQRMLRWHYRSRHESLISVSNHQFYENKLVVFPSPGSRHRLGLVWHHLKDTAYDRGKTRTNPKEAEKVVDAVVDHARRFPRMSLGVVAFSTAQRQAIQDALELRRRQNPELENFIKSHPHEPFFIKNLENVQGDERDVIFISIGYGRTAEGYVSMSFGPLNNDGGEKRLNVLITRAKLRCEVFTNLSADDIDTGKTNRFGIVALKAFLYFAQHGKLNLTEETGLPADSYFEEHVADSLSKLGYLVRKQIGSHGFYIDLAIVDPDHPGRYLLGIECDGRMYHSARSARDRDRLRQQVLEGIGWRIHRIWSTDWFKDPERELKRVVSAIEKAREMALVDDEQSIQEQAETRPHTALLREAAIEAKAHISLYEMASLPAAIAMQELHTHSIGKLASWIVEVVQKESPVHFDEVARRVIEAAGISRIGSRIREVLWEAANAAKKSSSIFIKGDFLWETSLKAPLVRDRSVLPAQARKFKYIAPEETAIAITNLVQESIAIQPEALVPLVAKAFGFSRVTEDLKKDVLEAIQNSVAQKIIRQEGGLLKSNG